MSVFFSTTFVQDGLLLLLLFSSASFLEMNAAADALAFESPPTPAALALSPPVFKLKFASFLPTPPTFTTTVTACPAVASCTLLVPFVPLFKSILTVVVFFSSSLAVLSDWKNLSLDCSVFAAVVEVRGAAVGLVLIEVVVVVKVDSQVVREAVGLETTDV